MSVKIDMINKMFGEITVLKELEPMGYGKKSVRVFECFCSCGNTLSIIGSNLRNGQTHCRKCKSTRPKTHGLSDHPLYTVWKSMIYRCYNENNEYYSRYGGRGIKVHKAWRGEEGISCFIEWNNSLPITLQWAKGLELDRENNDKGYYPSNCRWISKRKNVNNRSITLTCEYKGETLPLTEMIELYGDGSVSYWTARNRLLKGIKPLNCVRGRERNSLSLI